jgi:uncharacterized tellurite resistance protein B-like protein
MNLNTISMELKTETILSEYSDQEKGAYLGALASLATADRSASEEEKEHILEIANSAGLSQDQQDAVLRASTELSEDELKRCLTILKGSNLRYTLITDLIALAKADNSYTEDEQQNIVKIAEYLQVNKNQFSLLDQFVNKTAESGTSPEEISKPGFLESLGLQDKLKNAGFNLPSMRSLLGFLGPMLLAGMASKGLRRGNNTSLGGGLSGGGGFGLPGGFGSIISGLTRSRNNQSIGGLLSKLFR